MKKGFLAILLTGVAVIALLIPVAAPVLAAANNLSLTLGVAPNPTYNGTTVGYSISITNPITAIPGTTLNNANNVIVSFFPPGPNGLPVAVPTFVSAPFSLAAGGASSSLPVQNVLLALNSGVTVATATVTFSATLVSPTSPPLSGSQNIPLTVISPNTTVTITPSVNTVLPGGTVSLIVTEHNSDIGNLTAPNVVVTSVPGTTNPPMPLNLVKAPPYFVSGDTLNDGILGSGETWTWIVTGVVVNANTTFTANGDGIDLLGNHVNFNTVKGTTPGITTELASTAVNISNVPSIITVTSPNGGESWIAGTIHNITWAWFGFSGGVMIELSPDSGATWTTIAPAASNSGNRIWSVTGPATTHARIRISSVVSPSISDTSDADFTIRQNITVTAPNGGENWAIGTTRNITWTSVGFLGPVRVELSRDSGATWALIVPSTPNTGSLAWTVHGATTTQGRVRVSSVAFPAVSDISDADFNLIP